MLANALSPLSKELSSAQQQGTSLACLLLKRHSMIELPGLTADELLHASSLHDVRTTSPRLVRLGEVGKKSGFLLKT